MARVLLVDDDPDSLDIARDILASAGHTVVTADTLARGDAVRLSGNPARGGAKSLSLTKLEKAGMTLYDPQRMMAALASSEPASAAKASSLDGVWVTALDMEAMQGFVAPRMKLKLTEAGFAQEPGDRGAVVAQFLAQNFDGHEAVRRVRRLENR